MTRGIIGYKIPTHLSKLIVFLLTLYNREMQWQVDQLGIKGS